MHRPDHHPAPAAGGHAPPRPPAPGRVRRYARTLTQVVLLIGVWFAADRGAAWIGLPFSGGVVGLLLMVALLLTGTVKPAVIEHGADWLLTNMLLFFVPLVVSVVQFTSVLESEGIKLFISIGLGFTCVMLATGFTVEWVCRAERGRRLRQLRRARALLLAARAAKLPAPVAVPEAA